MEMMFLILVVSTKTQYFSFLKKVIPENLFQS